MLSKRTALALCFTVAMLSAAARPVVAASDDALVPATTVKIDTGLVRGASSARDRNVTEFLALPYAAPPTGALRWREPQPAPHWSGVRAADRHPARCMQVPTRANPQDLGSATRELSEDCLYLNVWTPARGAQARLPVMVWFHGGGLNYGSGSKNETIGQDLAGKGVVVVTVNYRLGALGYLVLPELKAESPHHTAGNYGLLDQIAALQWVKRNIAAFGGDVNNVTIFGFSAGSTSVNALQVSPLARGLFQRAIGESTANMNPAAGIWHLRTFAQAEDFGLRFMRQVGARSLAELRALPASALSSTGMEFWLIEDEGYALPGEIYDLYRQGRQNAVSVLVGATADEAATLGEGLHWVNPRTRAEEAAFHAVYGAAATPDDPQVTNDVVLWQMREWVRLSARAGVANSYLYFFTHVPPRPPQPTGAGFGAYHGAEIRYVFRTLHIESWPWSEADKQLQEILSSYWTNFARTGDPNGPGLPRWPRYSDAEVMELSASPHASPTPRAAALRYLDDFFAQQRAAGRDNLRERT